jgi:hypothetical protein
LVKTQEHEGPVEKVISIRCVAMLPILCAWPEGPCLLRKCFIRQFLYCLFCFYFVLFCLRRSLTMLPNMASNSRFSCLDLPSAGITAVCHHAQLPLYCVWINSKGFNWEFRNGILTLFLCSFCLTTFWKNLNFINSSE